MSNESSPPKGEAAEKHEETKPAAPEAAKDPAAQAPKDAPAEAAKDPAAEPAKEPAPELAKDPAAAVAKGSAADEPAVDVTLEEPPPLPPQVSKTSQLPPRLWPPRVVADIMTRKVITLAEDEPVGQLEAWMERFRFHHLPVVDGAGKLVGLISRVDFLHAALGRGPHGKPIRPLSADTRAAEIMNPNVVTAQIDAPLTTACEVVLRERLGCLPVLRDDGTLVGIVTVTDLARLGFELLKLATASAGG